jgi:hypothetical protein
VGGDIRGFASAVVQNRIKSDMQKNEGYHVWVLLELEKIVAVNVIPQQLGGVQQVSEYR